MTSFAVTIAENKTIVSCDDMVLLDGGAISFLCFIYEGIPKMMIPTDNIQAMEIIERGDWVGTGFTDMIRGEI